MSDIACVTRKTYQAPVRGARIRLSRRRAIEDWAHHIVRARLVALCECEGSVSSHPDEPSIVCVWHRLAARHRGRGVFSPEIRTGMKRRLAKMLAAGWRAPSGATEVEV